MPPFSVENGVVHLVLMFTLPSRSCASFPHLGRLTCTRSPNLFVAKTQILYRVYHWFQFILLPMHLNFLSNFSTPLMKRNYLLDLIVRVLTFVNMELYASYNLLFQMLYIWWMLLRVGKIYWMPVSRASSLVILPKLFTTVNRTVRHYIFNMYQVAQYSGHSDRI